MTPNRPDIEWIVAEVMRRLSRLVEQEQTPRQTSSTETEPARPVPTETARVEPHRSEPSRRTGDLVLDAKLVTLAAVQGQLDGVRRLLVPPRCVVTPAVRDELRKRHIRLEKQEISTPRLAGPAELWIGRCTSTPEGTRRADALVQSHGSAGRSGSDLPHMVREMAEAVNEEKQAALLLTDQPALALCLANRFAAGRAAVGNTREAASEAVRMIGANVLIVDPTKMTLFTWKQIVENFAPGLPRQVPAELRRDVNS